MAPFVFLCGSSGTHRNFKSVRKFYYVFSSLNVGTDFRKASENLKKILKKLEQIVAIKQLSSTTRPHKSC